ncbi:MAG: right-handed parallel beta-helix repeat-containing protein [Spirochaetota bacterium]
MYRKLLVLVLIAASAFAAVKPIADFGGKADGTFDNGPALQKAFTYAASHPGTTLSLGGVCRIATPQSNNAKWQYAAGGEYVTNLTIEDGEIILGGAFAALTFDHSPGLMLRNVAFDYDPPILSQGSVVATSQGERSITCVPDPGYPLPTGSGFNDRDGNWLTVHKPDGEYAFFFVGFIQSSSMIGDKARLVYDRPDMAAAIEGIEGLRYVRVRRALGHLNVFNFCDRLTLERVSVFSASAFASIFMFCNDVTLVSNRICPRPASGRIVATCADGFHFIGARRGPRIENNYFDHLQDDNIVISLRGNKVKSFEGNTLDLHAGSVTWYEKGDTIEVVEVAESRKSTYTIVAMEPYRWPWQPPRITLDRPLAGNVVPFDTNDTRLPTLVFNKSWRLDGTLIRNNRFQNTRRYAVFMGAGGVRIEDNVMSNHTSAAILCSYIENVKNKRNELNYYFSSDISIARNTIVNSLNYGEGGRKYAGRPAGAIDIYDFDRDAVGLGDLTLVHNLVIRDNRIVNSGALGIHVANASNVTVSGNMIIDPNRLSLTNRYGIWAEHSSAVNVSGNSVEGGSLDMPVKIDP